MEIKFMLDESECEKLLNKFGYTKEKIVAYYHKYDISSLFDPSKEVNDPKNLCGIDKIVAYKVGERPSFLDKKYPMCGECDTILYSKVVQNLFKTLLLDKIGLND